MHWRSGAACDCAGTPLAGRANHGQRVSHDCDGDEACDSYEMARISLVRLALCAMGDCGRMANRADSYELACAALGGRGEWLESDGKTACAQLRHQVIDAGFGAWRFGARERRMIGCALAKKKNMVGEHEDGVTDGDGRALFAACSGEGAEACPQDRVFAAADRLGGDDQTGAQPATAFAGLATFALACADVVARCHAGPTGEVGGGGELLHG